ncbi:hypothetical protein M8494_25140 [Serratia ureilytica]
MFTGGKIPVAKICPLALDLVVPGSISNELGGQAAEKALRSSVVVKPIRS